MATTVLTSVQSVIDRSGLSEVTLWRMRKRGEGPKWGRFGSRVMYDADDVERWISERLSAGAAEVAA